MYYKKGDYEKARKYLLKAESIVPNEPTIAEHLGDLYQAKGLKLVVRTHNSSLDENQTQQQILQTLNRGVLYEEGLDITDDVLKLLAEKGEKAEKSEKGKP